MINVAVIEDIDDYRNGIIAMLEWSDGVHCVAAYQNAEEAIKNLKDIQPHICLCDIGLPGINGIELVRWIRVHLPNTLCMMCTAYDTDEKVYDALKSGALGYILKSEQPGKIIEAIKELKNGGSPMSSEIARKVLLGMQPQLNAQNQIKLTPKEEQILQLLSQGNLYKEIAEIQQISIETVKRHCYNIYAKLHVSNRTEAVNKYYK
jgi:NarL family two-component system response regulator LiaR